MPGIPSKDASFVRETPRNYALTLWLTKLSKTKKQSSYQSEMSFGRPYILEVDGCIHDGWLLLRDEDNIFDLSYLCETLGSPNVFAQYKKLAAGGVVNNLNKEIVSGVQIPIPSKDEQKLIADFFTSFDEAITAAKQELENWNLLKKGLLQKMFV